MTENMENPTPANEQDKRWLEGQLEQCETSLVNLAAEVSSKGSVDSVESTIRSTVQEIMELTRKLVEAEQREETE
jgi:hypothetical protein